ncbi:MAG: type III polyketide synthase, partial [Pseudomonadota bacterium]|nr:type III polyketide synthase [Pseudomonadota bacterium]
MNLATAHIIAIGTAVPDFDVHHAYIDWAEQQLCHPRDRSLFRRMADRAAIKHRWSILPKVAGDRGPLAPGGFYGGEEPPSTSARMSIYAEAAPPLALEAIADLSKGTDTGGIT